MNNVISIVNAINNNDYCNDNITLLNKINEIVIILITKIEYVINST